MEDGNKGIQKFVLRTKSRSEKASTKTPKRLFLGMRLKGDLKALFPILYMERKNE